MGERHIAGVDDPRWRRIHGLEALGGVAVDDATAMGRDLVWQLFPDQAVPKPITTRCVLERAKPQLARAMASDEGPYSAETVSFEARARRGDDRDAPSDRLAKLLDVAAAVS